MSDDDYLRWLSETCGYIQPRIEHGRWTALEPMLFGAAKILRGRVGDLAGYSEEWMYPSAVEALLAYARWTNKDEGEPADWIRHKPSGRRVSQSPDERDENGQRVGAVGVVYVRP